MNIALIGLGHWGPRFIPKLLKHPGIESVYGHDKDSTRNQEIKREFPDVIVVSQYEKILKDPEVQAVIIATPAASHFTIAREALEHGKHVLVEKPLTDAVPEAKELVGLARHNNLKLMVDHITVYGGPVQALRGTIEANELGELLYFDAVRTNMGMLQQDVNVVWDLGIHEFAVLDYLIGEQPVAVSGVGLSRYGRQEEIAYITLYFRNNLIAHVQVSWLSPIKVRRLIIGGRRKMVVLDDTRPQGKLEIFNSGVDVSFNKNSAHPVIAYRRGAAEVLEYDDTEPLALMIDTFVRSIRDGHEPLTDGVSGLRMVRILAAVEESIKNKGSIIPVD